MKVKEHNVPTLRFPEFSGEWVNTLLEDIAHRGSGHTPSKNNADYYNGGIKWVSLADSGKLDNGFIEDTEIEISEEGINNSSAVIHPIGTVLLSRDAGVGKSAIMKSEMAVSQHFIVWRAKNNKLSNWFLYYTLQILKREFERIAVGSTVKTIGLPYFKKLRIPIPSFHEQQKIASFLTAVDTKIKQLSKKKSLLEQYKKGIMQKIFSQELRFKDEQGDNFPDWEKKRLSAHGKFKSGIGFSSTEQGGQDGVPFYKVSDMNLVGNECRMTRSNNYVSSEQVHRLKYKPINEPSIIFAKVGAAIFLERKRLARNFLIDNNMMAFIPASNLLFMKYVFDMIRLSKFAQVGALPSYNGSDLENIKISTPKAREEQRKIADFLSFIDKKIDLVSTELNHAQTFKKGLLQQMFV